MEGPRSSRHDKRQNHPPKPLPQAFRAGSRSSREKRLQVNPGTYRTSGHRQVHLSRGLLKRLSDITKHWRRVIGLSECIRTVPEEDWPLNGGIEPEPEDILDRVFAKLKEDYPILCGPLTETMVERIEAAFDFAYEQDFVDDQLELSPRTSEDFLNRGYAHCQKGDHAAADRDYLKGIGMDPVAPAGRLYRAECKFHHQGQSHMALEEADAAVRLCVGREDLMTLGALMLQAQIFADLRMDAESISSLKEFVLTTETWLSSAAWDETGVGVLPNGNTIWAEDILGQVVRGLILIRSLRYEVRDDPSDAEHARWLCRCWEP